MQSGAGMSQTLLYVALSRAAFPSMAANISEHAVAGVHSKTPALLR